MARQSTEPTSATTPKDSTQPSIASKSANSDKASFLDLPGELRNEVYGLLLPDVDLGWSYLPRSLRKDGEKTSTTFMASCKQVHAEAASILYGREVFYVDIDHEGEVTFLNQHIEFANLHTADFSAVNQMKRLRIHIKGLEGRNVCDVQDVLFYFLDHLRPSHKLAALDVSLIVELHDPHQCEDYWQESYREAYQIAGNEENLLREFVCIRPGDISRLHLAAFLTDPLRTLRLRNDCGEKTGFELDFIASEVMPWRTMFSNLQALVQGDKPISDYGVFCRAWQSLRSVLSAVEATIGTHALRMLDKTLDRVREARIRGDPAAVKGMLEIFIDRVELMVDMEMDPSLKDYVPASYVCHHQNSTHRSSTNGAE